MQERSHTQSPPLPTSLSLSLHKQLVFLSAIAPRALRPPQCARRRAHTHVIAPPPLCFVFFAAARQLEGATAALLQHTTLCSSFFVVVRRSQRHTRQTHTYLVSVRGAHNDTHLAFVCKQKIVRPLLAVVDCLLALSTAAPCTRLEPPLQLRCRPCHARPAPVPPSESCSGARRATSAEMTIWLRPCTRGGARAPGAARATIDCGAWRCNETDEEAGARPQTRVPHAPLSHTLTFN